MNKILIIQTAFIGDVILATALIESIAKEHPESKIDFVLRKGNEGILKNHPLLNSVIIWNKKDSKYGNLKKLIGELRQEEYDLLINLQRFGSSGYLSWRAKAKIKVGFKKNPFSFCYTYKTEHKIGNGTHEIERNQALLENIGSFSLKKPKLYPSDFAYQKAKNIRGEAPLIVMAPSSVWFTKQLPQNKWIQLIKLQAPDTQIVLIGGNADKEYLDNLVVKSELKTVQNMAGELDLLESAALISLAEMTYVNDSAPLHLASSVDAPVTAFFCSTIPDFGFGPLSDQMRIVQIEENLACRPCGLHGKKECPKGHFDCGQKIDVTIP